MLIVDYATLLDLVGLCKVVVFGGYSGRGYAAPAALAALLWLLLLAAGDHSFYVGGATKAGIAARKGGVMAYLSGDAAARGELLEPAPTGIRT